MYANPHLDIPVTTYELLMMLVILLWILNDALILLAFSWFDLILKQFMCCNFKNGKTLLFHNLEVIGVNSGLNDTRIDTQFACESGDCVG